MRWLGLKSTAILALALSLVTLAASAGPSSAALHLKPVTHATISGAFSATVVQGPGAGKSYDGMLRLTGTAGGYLQGALTVRGSKPIPVIGQLRGRLIGLSFSLGPNKTLAGTGIVGYDLATKTNTIGGTFSGPTDRSLGVWSYTRRVESTGGCTIGIPGGASFC